MDTIFELAFKIKEKLSSDERIVLLNSLEKEMNADKEIMILSYKKDLAVDEYEFAISHFSSESKEVDIAQKKMYEAKYNLDSNNTVRKYLKAYSEVRNLYLEISKSLFSIINKDLKGD